MILEEMKKDLFSISIDNQTHYSTMKDVYDNYGIILDPHGSVGWNALAKFTNNDFSKRAIIYETADPGKFPDDVEKAIGVVPELPARMEEQQNLDERIYSIESSPLNSSQGLKLSDEQVNEAKEKIKTIFSKS